MLLVKEFKEKNIHNFTEDFLQSLPEVCEEKNCGYPLIMSDTLMNLRCSNPRCPLRVKNRAFEIINRLNIDVDIEQEEVDEWVDNNRIKNPLLILKYDYDRDGKLAVDTSEDVCKEFSDKLKKVSFKTVNEYLKIAVIDLEDDTIDLLFKKNSNITEIYERIQREGLKYLSDLLKLSWNIDDKIISINAIRIAEILIDNKNDLMEVAKEYNLL